MKRIEGVQVFLAAVVLAAAFMLYGVAHAQSADQNQLRATIYAQVMKDPRSQNLTQAQVYALVNALADQAQRQNVTSSQIENRPEVPASTFTPCTNYSCSVAQAFGLDGSFPIIPVALFVMAALFIFLYSLMREMGHPHTQSVSSTPLKTSNIN